MTESARLLWLPDTLRAAGLRVAMCDGWETRGGDPPGPMAGVMLHHTAGPKTGNMPSLGVIRDGRPDLKGPLSQLGLGRDGTYYVVASGKANHAGKGEWNGIGNGNQRMIGIEAENTGYLSGPKADPWPDVQMDAYLRGVAAILLHLGLSPASCCGHKEYATPRGRKTDPTFDLTRFRVDLSRHMGGAVAPKPRIPIVAPSGRPTIARGRANPVDALMALQVLLSVVQFVTEFTAAIEAQVRQFQRDRGLVPDGVVGPKTWAALDAIGGAI
jgi:peptidoglycan hydrolase-like protein with peptidoglycan-binding domain